jgi:aspartate kinase
MGVLVQKFGGTSVANAEKIRGPPSVPSRRTGRQPGRCRRLRPRQADRRTGRRRLELNPNPPARNGHAPEHRRAADGFAVCHGAARDGPKGHQLYRPAGPDGHRQRHTKARIQSIGAERIRQKLDQGYICIVAGFQGVDDEGNITTLGRGGSDTSAVALAAALNAPTCDIYTDVDGIYTADPRKYPKAVKMEQISYDEMLELASLGAGVMHSRSIEFGKKYNVQDSCSQQHERYDRNHYYSRGTSNGRNSGLRRNMPKRPGQRLRSSAWTTSPATPPDICPPGHAQGQRQRHHPDRVSSEKANLSFTVPFGPGRAKAGHRGDSHRQVGCEKVFVREDIAEVSVVGVGMRSHCGVAEKMFKALAEKQINIDSITTSEIRISCLVDLRPKRKPDGPPEEDGESKGPDRRLRRVRTGQTRSTSTSPTRTFPTASGKTSPATSSPSGSNKNAPNSSADSLPLYITH